MNDFETAEHYNDLSRSASNDHEAIGWLQLAIPHYIKCNKYDYANNCYEKIAMNYQLLNDIDNCILYYSLASNQMKVAEVYAKSVHDYKKAIDTYEAVALSVTGEESLFRVSMALYYSLLCYLCMGNVSLAKVRLEEYASGNINGRKINLDMDKYARNTHCDFESIRLLIMHIDSQSKGELTEYLQEQMNQASLLELDLLIKIKNNRWYSLD